MAVSLEGMAGTEPQTAANLFIVHIDPKQALRSIVRKQIPSGLLARRVLASRIYQSLVEVAPGLKELAFLSRLKDVSEGPEPRTNAGFGHVVWDAPATGHFLEILRVSRKFETYLTGPFASRGRELARYFASTDLRLLPVTTLEEMAVEETLEMCRRLRDEFDLLPERLICNMVSPLHSLPRADLEAYRGSFPRADGPGVDMAFIWDRHVLERDHFERLRSSVGPRSVLIERVHHRESDLELLSCVAKQLETIDDPRS